MADDNQGLSELETTMAPPPDSSFENGTRIEDIDIDISPSFSQMPEEGLKTKSVQNGDDCVENTVKENGRALGSEGEEGEEEKEEEREKENAEDEKKVVNGEEEKKGTKLKMGKEEEEERRNVGREEEEEEEKVKSDKEEDEERVKRKEEKEEEEVEENMSLRKQELEEKNANKEKEEEQEDKIENEKKEEKETVKKDEDEKMKKEEKEEEETVKIEGEKKEERAKNGEEEDEEEEEDTSDTTGDEEEEEVDPRVAENLEVMNHSCAEVNRLENELDEARSKYRSTFQTSSQKMEELGGKMKKTIQRARLYYELIDKARQAQSEALRSARLYQSANGTYRAAVEMVTLAEKGLVDDAADNSSKTAATRTLSSAWQEHLNHAIERVSEAEREKTHTEADHNKKAAICAQLEGRLKFLEKKYKRSIAKARPYFETKAELELKLQQLKQNIVDLQQAIGARKARYSEAMRCLEAVSTEIHESRRTRRTRKNLLLQYPREPGVGAETDSLGSGISEPNIERSMFSTSTLNLHNDEDDDDDDYDESDDVGNLSDPESTTSSGSTAPRRQVSRSLSRRLTPKPSLPEDLLTSQGHPSEGVFSRSVSSCSVFSSEGHSDTASEPPGSPRLPVHHKSPAEKKLLLSSSPSLSGSAPSLMDMVRGDLNHPLLQNKVAEKQPGSGVAAVSGDKSVAKGVSSSPVAQGSSEAEEGFVSEFCEREAGDGSAQDDCCPTEPLLQVGPQDGSQNPSSSGLDPTPASLLHSAQGGVSVPQGNPQSSASSRDKGGPEAVKSAGVPSSAGGCGMKKAPLRRTDAPVHRPLQGVLLLNPSDLAQTSFHYAPRR